MLIGGAVTLCVQNVGDDTLTAAGHGNTEIAARLDLSVKTVETYPARSLEKLGSRVAPNSSAAAFQQGCFQDG